MQPAAYNTNDSMFTNDDTSEIKLHTTEASVLCAVPHSLSQITHLEERKL